jgi:hypothetical protein
MNSPVARTDLNQYFYLKVICECRLSVAEPSDLSDVVFRIVDQTRYTEVRTIRQQDIRNFLVSYRYRKSVNFLRVPVRKTQIRKFS